MHISEIFNTYNLKDFNQSNHATVFPLLRYPRRSPRLTTGKDKQIESFRGEFVILFNKFLRARERERESANGNG